MTKTESEQWQKYRNKPVESLKVAPPLQDSLPECH